MATGLGHLLMVLEVQSQWRLGAYTGADGDARDFCSLVRFCYRL
jgi:hypothetical protein